MNANGPIDPSFTPCRQRFV